MKKFLSETPAPNTRRSGLSLPFGRSGIEPAPQYTAVETVQRHWDTLRADRVAPGRDEIDPRQLAECLDMLFIAELVAPRIARLRLCGQHLHDLLGLEPRGMPLAVFFEAPARETLADALAQVAQGARVLLPVRSERSLGRPLIEGRLLLLPLTDHSGKITRIMGLLETHGPAGRAPRKFGLLDTQINRPASKHQPPPNQTSDITRVLRRSLDNPPHQATPRDRRAAFRVIDGGRSV